MPEPTTPEHHSLLRGNVFTSSTEKYKVVNDSVHGHIRLKANCFDIIDTPQFQRLRDLMQLGTSYYVFPGGSHNRFEHCIGVGYLAGDWLQKLKANQPELEVSETDIDIVRTAGLCHDLGHGPFSHVFENEFMPRVLGPNHGWHHEDASLRMFNDMVDENQIEWLDPHRKMVEKLISGDPKSTDRNFLYQIVANSKNSIDVDKFDYIARDCNQLGIKSNYDFSRLMEFSRVINDEICFHTKQVYNLYELFHTRYSLHKQVYSHRVSKAVEYMITDALVLANSHLKIAESVSDPKRYCNLTDSIIKYIEFSQDAELKDARKIIQRLRKRDLYKFVDEILLPPQSTPKVTEMDVASSQEPGANLRPEDLIVQTLRINYAMKDRNPVDHARFYMSVSDTESITISKDQVSLLIPDRFQERYIRLYCRDPSKVEQARAAFGKCLQNKKIVPAGTPVEAGVSPYQKRRGSYSGSPPKMVSLDET